jgi:hypothetical protein
MTTKKMAIIATKGARVFTFYGPSLLRKDINDIRISPLANPAMPMPAMPVTL